MIDPKQVYKWMCIFFLALSFVLFVVGYFIAIRGCGGFDHPVFGLGMLCICIATYIFTLFYD